MVVELRDLLELLSKTPKYRHVTDQPQHVSCLVCLAPRTNALLDYVLRSHLLAKQNTRFQKVYETMYMVHETLEGYLRPRSKSDVIIIFFCFIKGP
jgi:hypothetical protein